MQLDDPARPAGEPRLLRTGTRSRVAQPPDLAGELYRLLRLAAWHAYAATAPAPDPASFAGLPAAAPPAVVPVRSAHDA
jgi:hypothetical protein